MSLATRKIFVYIAWQFIQCPLEVTRKSNTLYTNIILLSLKTHGGDTDITMIFGRKSRTRAVATPVALQWCFKMPSWYNRARYIGNKMFFTNKNVFSTTQNVWKVELFLEYFFDLSYLDFILLNLWLFTSWETYFRCTLYN